MSRTEKDIALNLINEGYDKDEVLDHIYYGGWLEEYIEQTYDL